MPSSSLRERAATTRDVYLWAMHIYCRLEIRERDVVGFMLADGMIFSRLKTVRESMKMGKSLKCKWLKFNLWNQRFSNSHYNFHFSQLHYLFGHILPCTPPPVLLCCCQPNPVYSTSQFVFALFSNKDILGHGMEIQIPLTIFLSRKWKEKLKFS